MLRRVFRTACAALLAAASLVSLLLPVTQAHAQSVTIPLEYYKVNGWSLGINIGINGGAPQPYLFDTGSAVFNAAWNPATWQGFGQNVPAATVPNGSGVHYCYGSPPCYTGNLVQVPVLNFYAAGATAGSTPAATLSASPGYQVNAVYNETNESGTRVENTFPEYFQTHDKPPLYKTFYGIFGAGNFTDLTNTSAIVGGVLGQTILPGVQHQGYVVSANGQPNPASYDSDGTPHKITNSPSGTQIVTIGGQTRQVSPCIACVTVGLTPQLIGQFAPVSATGQVGVVPWALTGTSFPNPYGSGTGNNGSRESGSNFTTTLPPGTSGGSTVSNTALTLLDTGTALFVLANPMGSGDTNTGSTLTISGASPSGGTVSGIPTSTSTLAGPPSSEDTYSTQIRSGSTNTLGIPFFMQNSVMFDLTGQAIGYTPFYVTPADLVTTANGPLVVDGSNLPLGLAGVISGPGGVTIHDGGAVQLSATNTYTGPTKLDSGAQLLISGPGSIAASSGVVNDGLFDISRAWNPVAVQNLTGSGQVNLGGQNLTITNANGGSFGGIIADGGAWAGTGGSVTLTGGLLFLTGVNTYTGGTTVTGGAMLGISADSGLGAVSGGLTLAGGQLVALADLAIARQVTLGAGGGAFETNGFNVVLGTAVTGVGGLTKNGLGILTLSGANSYTGGTTVNAGTLQLAPGASLPSTGPLTVNGGTLDFNGNNVTIGSLSGLGGTIALGASTLTVAEQGSSTFAGTLTGTGGLTLQGPGALSLTGANTYTGPTNVTGGRLAVNGSITSNVTVGAGGNLGGIGTITGTVTNNGIASPGNSIGTLNVVGAYTQAAGSSYQVETNAAGQADRINVTGAPGTATIAGGTVTLTAASGVYAPSTTYTILNAAGGVTGTYAGAYSLFPFLQPSLAYDANNVYLTLKPGGFGAGAATPNQAAVGRVLDQSVAGSSGDLATVIGTMATYTQGQGQAAMNAISGQNYSGFGTANLGGGLLFMNMMGQQMSLARGGFASGTRVAVAQACEAAAAEACVGEAATPWTLWGSALGGTGSVAGNANAGALSYNASGFAAGADYRFDPRFLAGFAVGYANGNQWASGFSGQGTTNSYQASLYGSFTQAAFYLDGLAGYGYNDNQMTRQIVLPNLAARTAQGRVGANQFLGQLEAGYRIGINERSAASITPFARFQGTTNSQLGFSESGAGALNLTVAPQTTGSARSVLGAELAGAFGPEGREKLALQLRLGWAHEYADTTRPVTASFAGAPGAGFTVFGAAPTRDAATFSLAANTVVAASTSLYLRYDGETGNGTISHALNGGFRITW